MTRVKSLFVAAVVAAIVSVVPASAQTVHVVGAGSSAQFLGTMIAFSTLANNNLASGECIFHWTKKSVFNAHDNRDVRILDELNNGGIVWDAACSDPTGATNITDVWIDTQYDSTLGNRLFFAQQKDIPADGNATPGATIFLSSSVTGGLASDNLVLPNNLWADNKADVGIPAGVIAVLGTASPGTQHVNLGLTDIRPEDALAATTRAFGALDSTKWTKLGYVGPTSQIGAPIYTGLAGSTSNLTPIGFSLAGGTDPINKTCGSGHNTACPVPASSTIPVGAAPIVFAINLNGLGTGGTFDAGIADLKVNLNLMGGGGPYNLVHLWDGTSSCDTNNAVFGAGDGNATPLTVLLREPLSGTMNTTEYTVFRTAGNSTDSQEVGVINPTRAPYNPLNLACNGSGTRTRRVANGQVINAINGSDGTTNAIGYFFFSFANSATVDGGATNNASHYQYFTMNGVDPIYSSPSANPQGSQELPYCHNALCPFTGGPWWTSGLSFPNLRNGTYPAWSVYRWLVYPCGGSGQPACDPLGPQVTAQYIQDYIDSTVTDFVPFLACPTGDTNPICTANNTDGLAVYRQHYTQSGKTCSYTGTGNQQFCDGTQQPTNANGGNSLGGGLEQGGDEGGIIMGWDYATVSTVNVTSGACKGLTKVSWKAGRKFGFSSTFTGHTGGDPLTLEGLPVSVNNTGATVSSCIAPSATTIYVEASLGTLNNVAFAVYIPPVATGVAGGDNGAIGKRQ